MSKYFVFAGSWYYPAAGVGDFLGAYDTVREAAKKAHAAFEDWAQIATFDASKFTLLVEADGYGTDETKTGQYGKLWCVEMPNGSVFVDLADADGLASALGRA